MTHLQHGGRCALPCGTFTLTVLIPLFMDACMDLMCFLCYLNVLFVVTCCSCCDIMYCLSYVPKSHLNNSLFASWQDVRARSRVLGNVST